MLACRRYDGPIDRAPFMPNHGRYFVSSSYIFRLLDEEGIKPILEKKNVDRQIVSGTWSNAVYNLWQNRTILHDTYSKRLTSRRF